MQGGRDPFFGFGDPFGRFGGFGGFGGERGLMSSFFRGRDPFDDPFFTRPFGSMFESNFFGSNGGPFMNPNTFGFLEHQPNQPNRSRGPVIEELSSDDEECEKKSEQEIKDNPRKHGRSGKEPFVEYPDDEIAGKKIKHVPQKSEINQMQHLRSQPQSHSFTFQSSTVSYGGANGTYYISSRTRSAGSDGKLKSDGHVDTMQTLHNLNEDEFLSFEEAWKGNARKNLPGLPEGFANGEIMGSGSSGQHRVNRGGGWAIPSIERSNNRNGSLKPPHVGQRTGHLPRTRQEASINPDLNDGIGSAQFRSNGTGSSNQRNRF